MVEIDLRGTFCFLNPDHHRQAAKGKKENEDTENDSYPLAFHCDVLIDRLKKEVVFMVYNIKWISSAVFLKLWAHGVFIDSHYAFSSRVFMRAKPKS